jgi:hypothetical protein
MLFAGDFHARTYPWQATARAWLENEADSGRSSAELLMSLGRASASSKTCPAFLALTEAAITSPSFEGWRNSVIASRGRCLTLNTSEFRSGAIACSLSEVLETEVAPKYFLSPKACAGILRRAEKAGQEVAGTIGGSSQSGGFRTTDLDNNGAFIAARMTAFGEYVDDGTASTLKQRDYKDATDLVAFSCKDHGADAGEVFHRHCEAWSSTAHTRTAGDKWRLPLLTERAGTAE